MTGPGRQVRAASAAPAVAWVSVVAVSVVAAACVPPPVTMHAPTAPVEVAPYVDVTLDEVPDLAQAVRRGVRTVNLGFVTAADGECRPAWGGTVPGADPEVTRRVGEVRAAGGDVRIAFGGESGTELAVACRTPSDLARAYQEVVDALAVARVDLDVESGGLHEREAVHRRNLAVRLLEQAAARAGRPLHLSYTLPADEDGLTADAQDLLRDAARTGVEVDVVNVMTMDTGTQAPDLAGVSAHAAEGAEAFVRGLWPGRASGGSAWRMIAVTPMIGRNDLPAEVFGLDDAERLAAFARAHGLAWLSFWSLNRDQACVAGTGDSGAGRASPTCSGIGQRPGDFTSAFSRPGP